MPRTRMKERRPPPAFLAWRIWATRASPEAWIAARREGVEAIRVEQHRRRLVEGADQILAGRDVDPGLAADRAVDLGKQSGRNLDQAAAALEDRGGEAHKVADHAAAEGDEMIAARD